MELNSHVFCKDTHTQTEQTRSVYWSAPRTPWDFVLWFCFYFRFNIIHDKYEIWVDYMLFLGVETGAEFRRWQNNKLFILNLSFSSCGWILNIRLWEYFLSLPVLLVQKIDKILKKRIKFSITATLFWDRINKYHKKRQDKNCKR